MPNEYTIKLAEQELVVKVGDAKFQPAKHTGTPPTPGPSAPGFITGAQARLEAVEFGSVGLTEGRHEVASVTITEGGNPVFEALESTVTYTAEGSILVIREQDRADGPA